MTKIERGALSLLVERTKAHASARELREVGPAIAWIERQFRLDARRRKKRGLYNRAA